MLVLRPAEEREVTFVWGMLLEAIDVRPGESRPRRDVFALPEIHHGLGGWGRPGDVGFVAELETRPAGAIWCRLFTKDDTGFGFVAEDTPEMTMALLPEWRSKGIGTTLVACCCRGPAFRASGVFLGASAIPTRPSTSTPLLGFKS